MVDAGMAMKETRTALEDPLQTRFEVSVLMRCRPVHHHRWISEVWEAEGVVWGQHLQASSATAEGDRADARRRVFDGLRLRLHKDEAESYYHNLMAPVPKLYVLTRVDEGGSVPEPFHVTASFDEGHAYLEGEDDVHTVAMPTGLVARIEHFVLAHYVPRLKRKRKRRDWHQESER